MTKGKRFRVFWRVQDGAGLLGRLGQESIERAKEVVQRVRPLPRQEGEEQSTTPSFGSAPEEVPEEAPDESQFKADLVDRNKSKNQKPTKSRVM